MGPSGGALLAETLFTLGVRDVFTLHGGHLDTFFVACPGVGIRLIDTRHEASAGHAAEAYAMSRPGEVGVCVVTAGPGFTNVLTAMANAYANAVPTLFIAGAPPMAEEATNELQGGINQVSLAAPISKWAHRISAIERLPDQIEKAMRLARSGRPGPVFIEIPINVIFKHASRIYYPVAADRPLPTRPTIAPETARQALDLIAAAERPIIIAGGGAVLSNATDPISRFSRQTGIPVVSNAKAHGLLPPDHPNYCGTAGTLAAANADGGERADLVILAGARAGLLLGGRSGAIIPPDAKIVQVDIDGAEIGRLTPVTVGMAADCSAAFDVMASQAERRTWPDWTDWVGRMCRIRAVSPWDDAPAHGTGGRIHPHHAARAVFAAIGEDAIVAVDGGEMTAWCEPLNRATFPGGYLMTGYLGTLGVGPGFAIAAAVARPDRRVFLLSGDGSVGFNLQEFDTMVRHGLPIVTVVMNNACWGLSKNAQDVMFGADRRSVVMLRDADYDRVAIALGGYGERVTQCDDIGPAIARAVASGLPSCINVSTDPDVMHPMTYSMTGTKPGQGKIVMPYYQSD